MYFIKKYEEAVEMTSDRITAAAKRVMKEDGYLNPEYIIAVTEYSKNPDYYEALIDSPSNFPSYRFISKEEFDSVRD